MTTSVLSLRLPTNLKQDLKVISDSCDRTNSYIAIKAIEEYINQNNWKIKELKKATLEADKGKFISHNSMEKWVDSLGSENELSSPKIDIFFKNY